jgi:hypothetical protein
MCRDAPISLSKGWTLVTPIAKILNIIGHGSKNDIHIRSSGRQEKNSSRLWDAQQGDEKIQRPRWPPQKMQEA